jgi:predicted kinase
VEQIERARSIADIASVQVSLSPFDRAASRSGVVEYCRAHGLRLYAYRPLGGERRRSLVRHAALTAIAEAHAATPEQIVLAWLASAGVVPLAGATTVEHAQATGRAQHIALGVEEIAALDTLFSAQDLRPGARAQRPPLEAPGEVVLVMGMPGAGKSTLAAGFTAQGYQRLNRDARGGSLATLAGALDEGLRSGHRTWVLDNTYASRASRREVIETAWRHGVPVRCIHLVTSVADAQINAVSRLLDAHGRLPMPEELRALGRRDPRYLGPDALFRYERALEKPSLDEGFSRIEERPFAREAPDDAGPRALILDLDDLVPGAREARSFEDVARLELPASHRHATAAARADGMLIFAIAWRPQPGADALFNALAERVVVLLGFEVTCGVCPHPAGPPICWCRKPIPGLVLEFAARHAVSLRRSLVVGRSSADRTMATRLGIAFQDASTFFRDEP